MTLCCHQRFPRHQRQFSSFSQSHINLVSLRSITENDRIWLICGINLSWLAKPLIISRSMCPFRKPCVPLCHHSDFHFPFHFHFQETSCPSVSSLRLPLTSKLHSCDWWIVLHIDSLCFRDCHFLYFWQVCTLSVFDTACIVLNITIFSGPVLSETYRHQVQCYFTYSLVFIGKSARDVLHTIGVHRCIHIHESRPFLDHFLPFWAYT